MQSFLEGFPVATFIHVLVAVVLGVDLLLDSELSKDAIQYAAIVEGGNGLLAIGRGQKKK
jgi:hypothetical protein